MADEGVRVERVCSGVGDAAHVQVIAELVEILAAYATHDTAQFAFGQAGAGERAVVGTVGDASAVGPSHHAAKSVIAVAGNGERTAERATVHFRTNAQTADNAARVVGLHLCGVNLQIGMHVADEALRIGIAHHAVSGAGSHNLAVDAQVLERSAQTADEGSACNFLCGSVAEEIQDTVALSVKDALIGVCGVAFADGCP